MLGRGLNTRAGGKRGPGLLVQARDECARGRSDLDLGLRICAEFESSPAIYCCGASGTEHNLSKLPFPPHKRKPTATLP